MRRNLLVAILAVALLVGCSSPPPAGPEPGGPPTEYTAQQLSQWYNELNKHIGRVGSLSWTDLDEQAKKIHIAVGTIEGKAQAEEAVRLAGIPAEAVIIELPEGALSEADPLAGCRVTEKPPAEASESRYTLKLDDQVVRPGQEITAVVEGAGPNRVTRGIDAYLECWDGSQWSPRYTMFSDGGGGGGGPSAAIYRYNGAIITIGFDAARPGRFKMPFPLEHGWYRVRMNVYATEGDRSVSHELWTLVEVATVDPAGAESAVRERARLAMQALQAKDAGRLADLAHPNKGVRFSPSAFVHFGEDGDLIFTPGQLRKAAADPTIYRWGTQDGSGEPIEMTLQAYLGRLAQRDYLSAAQVGYNQILKQGNTRNNIEVAYPDGVFVEYHLPGTGEMADFTWSSMRLVFEQEQGTWYLVGVISDQWSI